MSSVINTNMAAIRTHNVYNRNNINMNAAMTRVATGQKINSAKDGASTWAISEKMRERIRANDQANQNVQNDQALLKTAQGGIGNTIDILKTLKERAVNAANDSNTNEDRARIATEVNQLIKQIDENVEKVKFNGKLLLDGTYADPTEKTFEAKPEPGATSAVTVEGTAVEKGGALAERAVFESAALTIGNYKEHGSVGTSGVSSASTSTKLVDLLNSGTSGNNSAVTEADHLFKLGDVVKLSFTLDGKAYENTFTVKKNSTWSDLLDGGLTDNGVTVQWKTSQAEIAGDTKTVDATGSATNTAVQNTANALTIYTTAKNKVLDNVLLSVTGDEGEFSREQFIKTDLALTAKNMVYKAEGDETTAAGLTFYVGGESGFATNVGINSMYASDLGVSSLANSMLEKGTAEKAISTIDSALQKALNEQTKLGAWESRLGYTSDNLVTMNENLEAADSVMRDADIAKEMTSYMRSAVLSQASQYMLAQAGQNAFSVLNLLQA